MHIHILKTGLLCDTINKTLITQYWLVSGTDSSKITVSLK